MSGVNKQKALKFHGILMNTLRTKVCGLFSISQIQCAFRGDLFVQNNERILLANSIFNDFHPTSNAIRQTE